jgi:hypothetical protein
MPFFLEMILPVRYDEQTVLRVDLEGNALVDEIATEQSVKPAAGDCVKADSLLSSMG